MRKFLVIYDNLSAVFQEEDLRINWETVLGLKVFPECQALHQTPPVTVFEIVDPTKAAKYLNHPKAQVVEGVPQINTVLTELFSDFEEYTLIDSAALTLDWELSGKPPIAGYDAKQPINAQMNLKALETAGMGGIKRRKKPQVL